MGKRAKDAVDKTLGFFGEDAVPEERKGRPGVTRSVSVHMDIDMRDAFQEIADANGIARSAVMRYALAWWLHEYEAGNINIEFEKTRQVKMPGG
jgi:hypothetical protein